jgi:hypothetical protein
VPYTPFYPTWRDLPNTTTPIIAASLQNMESGIAAAQNTAEQALSASAGGGGGAGYVIVPGLALNGLAATPTDDGPAIQAALEAVEDGGTGGHLFVTGAAGSTGYINSTITMSLSGMILEFDPSIVWRVGTNFRLRPWGVIPETPTANPDKPALVADADAGDTVLYLDKIPTDWATGIYVGIRGKRTASGSVPDSEIHHSYVTAIDTTAKTITIADALPKEFLVLWDTTWTNKKSQVTKVIQVRLTDGPAVGDTVITVEDTSIFAVNDVVQILDNKHTIDGDDSIRDGNYAHKETNIIVEIIDATHLKLTAPVVHPYDPAGDGRVQRLDALRNSQVKGLRLRFREQMADGQHAVEVRYAVNTHVVDTDIRGTGDGGVSWSGHGIRFTDSLYCSAQRGNIANPALVTAGRGYGVSFYGSTSCWVQDFAITGCRHSVLWFNGSSMCEARNVISSDARISDFDWHGAEESFNRTVGCTAQGGTRSTADSDGRAAWKFGNPSQTNGAFANTATDCLVINYHGAAVHSLPRSANNTWQGVVRSATVGIRVDQIPDNATAIQTGLTIRDSEFHDVRAPLDIDGGTNGIVQRLALDHVTFTGCGPLQLISAPGARLHDVVVKNPTGSGWQVMAWDSDGIAITDGDVSGAPKGYALTGCADARVTGNRLHDLAGAELHDGGGNTGLLFRSNEIHPGAGTFTLTGSASSSTTIQAGMASGGTESIGSAVTGTTYADPEDALGGDGSTPPGEGGGGTGGDDTEPPPTPPTPTPGVMPLIGRSGKAWNSGVARWKGNQTGTPAFANAFGTWRGRPVDGFLNFPPRQTWADMFFIPSDWAAWTGYIINCIPPQPESEGGVGGKNVTTAAGGNDTRWVNYGSALTAAGLNRSRHVTRLGWECNGYWYKWSYGDENGNKTPQNSILSFQQAVQHVSTSLKSTAGNTLIEVTLNRGSNRSGSSWQSIMDPMLPYLDIIGLDHYDWYPGQRTAANWASARGQQPGFADLRTYLQANNKKLGVPEWALVNASGGSAGGAGGDDSYFIQKMHDEFAQLAALGLLAYEGYYDDIGSPQELNHLLTTGQYPNAANTYRLGTNWGS